MPRARPRVTLTSDGISRVGKGALARHQWDRPDSGVGETNGDLKTNALLVEADGFK